jgi:hypothetical protein
VGLRATLHPCTELLLPVLLSTCNSGRWKLTFCSVCCWDIHLPEARHRDAGAIEEVARGVRNADVRPSIARQEQVHRLGSRRPRGCRRSFRCAGRQVASITGRSPARPGPHFCLAGGLPEGAGMGALADSVSMATGAITTDWTEGPEGLAPLIAQSEAPGRYSGLRVGELEDIGLRNLDGNRRHGDDSHEVLSFIMRPFRWPVVWTSAFQVSATTLSRLR